MHALNDVHQQFAEYFGIPALKPYAYLLSKKLSEGHICLHLDQLTTSAEDLPAYYLFFRAAVSSWNPCHW